MKITIVNKRKFIRSLVVLAGLIMLILLGMSNTYSKP